MVPREIAFENTDLHHLLLYEIIPLAKCSGFSKTSFKALKLHDYDKIWNSIEPNIQVAALQVKLPYVFAQVPHNNVSNYCRAKVTSFPKGKK